MHKGPFPALQGAIRGSFVARTDTLQALSQFRARAGAARTQNAQVKEQKTDVDFEHYRSVLKNKDVVAEAEKIFKSFKPVEYDVNQQIQAIEAFEAKAVRPDRSAHSRP